MWIELWSHVGTNMGDGIVVGRSVCGKTPNYDIRLFSWVMCASYDNPSHHPVVSQVELIERFPIDHPLLPQGMRDHMKRSMPVVIETLPSSE